MIFWEAHRRSLHDQREFSSYSDRALMAVGRAGTGWSFAFDGNPASFDRQRFVSPAPAAGAGTRAVVVWSGGSASVSVLINTTPPAPARARPTTPAPLPSQTPKPSPTPRKGP